MSRERARTNRHVTTVQDTSSGRFGFDFEQRISRIDFDGAGRHRPRAALLDGVRQLVRKQR